MNIRLAETLKVRRLFVFHSKPFFYTGISKDRWVHHTSFLWDYESKNMKLLKIPSKRPDYRGERSHEAFLTKLCNYLPSKKEFYNQVQNQFQHHFDSVNTIALKDVQDNFLNIPHRKATKFIDARSS